MRKFKFNYNVVLVLLVIASMFMIGMAYMLEINGHEESADKLFWFAIVMFVLFGAVLLTCSVIDFITFLKHMHETEPCSICGSEDACEVLSSISNGKTQWICEKCFIGIKTAINEQ